MKPQYIVIVTDNRIQHENQVSHLLPLYTSTRRTMFGKTMKNQQNLRKWTRCVHFTCVAVPPTKIAQLSKHNFWPYQFECWQIILFDHAIYLQLFENMALIPLASFVDFSYIFADELLAVVACFLEVITRVHCANEHVIDRKGFQCQNNATIDVNRF